MTELTTAEAVRAHYGEPPEIVLRKEITAIDRYCRDFIAASPLVILATSDGKGRCDATPRGDPPGSVKVADSRTLLIPDRRGNNRVDALMNIVENPHAGLLFIVPGKTETLRVNGSASITIDPGILSLMEEKGKAPCAAIRLAVEEVYFQCGKALVRSELWNPDRHVQRDAFPPFGKILSEQCRIDYDPGLEEFIDEEYRNALY